MTFLFFILAGLTLAGAVAAMMLRSLVHCALALTVAFAGLAALYLNLGAQFAGLAQILVYVGAVAILIVFAILLTPGPQDRHPEAAASKTAKTVSFHAVSGGLIALAVFAILAWAVLTSGIGRTSTSASPQTDMQQIGAALMQRYLVPLEVIGLMLTAALIGAVILALQERSTPQ